MMFHVDLKIKTVNSYPERKMSCPYPWSIHLEDTEKLKCANQFYFVNF